VAQGKQYFSSDITATLASNNNSTLQTIQNGNFATGLTSREIEILQLIAQGHSNKEIGEKLFISHRTVDTHRTNLMKKLDINNIAGLIRFAIQKGLVG
jgi:two-component system response regulator NreC